ncbi:Putative protein [Zobellia galactanivorans]|uniref:Uncharacterized protein n=1 Tax=Zobellia galactanivorans (strain DSM 12802 / CCUG 47099 / CIP 106680 / NCIMB 13871 / Dsij) TaxID=63186 RepID=G0LCQ0_ZOBGA|nr:Putative protein [Zobellia galactanivorans]
MRCYARQGIPLNYHLQQPCKRHSSLKFVRILPSCLPKLHKKKASIETFLFQLT